MASDAPFDVDSERMAVACVVFAITAGALFSACGPAKSDAPGFHPRPNIEVASFVEEGSRAIREVVVRGPVGDLDFTSDGVSIFEPVSVQNNATQTETARSVFDFVAHKIPSWNVSKRITTSGLLYGTGYGMCIDQARVLVALWHRHGIEGRLVSSADHSAAEAFVDGGWRFFDPQHHLDHSRALGFPASFSNVTADPPQWPFFFDPIGYDVNWIHRIYRGMKTQKRVDGWLPLHPPNLKLRENESLRIYPRATVSGAVLPLSPVPTSRFRADLIDTYVAELKHIFRAGEEAVCFSTGLPLIGIETEEPQDLNILWHRDFDQWQRRDESRTSPITLAALRRRVLGSAERLCLTGPPDTTVILSYALAGWIGDRLVRPPVGTHLAILADRPCRATFRTSNGEPTIEIRDVRIDTAVASGRRSRVDVEVSWTGLTSPAEYTVVVEELASRLLVEKMRDLRTLQVSLPFRRDSQTGSGVVALKWTEPEPLLNRGGPKSDDRFLLVRIRGKGIAAGRNHRLLVVRRLIPAADGLPAQPPFHESS